MANRTRGGVLWVSGRAARAMPSLIILARFEMKWHRYGTECMHLETNCDQHIVGQRWPVGNPSATHRPCHSAFVRPLSPPRMQSRPHSRPQCPCTHLNAISFIRRRHCSKCDQPNWQIFVIITHHNSKAIIPFDAFSSGVWCRCAYRPSHRSHCSVLRSSMPIIAMCFDTCSCTAHS